MEKILTVGKNMWLCAQCQEFTAAANKLLLTGKMLCTKVGLDLN
jgi:formylmethanofuran dehydrogenase subunit E